MNTIILTHDDCVGLLFSGGGPEFVGEELINGSPSVSRSAENLRLVRRQFLTDPLLWAMVCHARAWGERGALPRVWALTD